MRYPPEHKEKTREKVLAAAARAMKQHGVEGVGVAAVMAEAGLTHGGFYAHFPSREALIEATLDYALEQVKGRYLAVIDGKAPAEALGAYIDFYLSRGHRDRAVDGCVVAALSAEAWRMNDAARSVYGRAHAMLADALSRLIPPDVTDDPKALALSMTAEMVGAITLARATPDLEASDALLAACRASLKARAGVTPPRETLQ